jgi:NitT/TauT family transport system substrate-binding protein
MRRRGLLITGIVAIVVLVAATFFLWTRSKPAPEPGIFRVGYQPTMLYLPVFVAQERGFFANRGLQVELVRFGSANEMAQALATNRIDATGMSSLTVLANLEQNSPGIFRIYLLEVLTAELSPDALVVIGASEIRALTDVRGKRLGLHPGTTLRAYAERFLHNALGADHGVIFVPLQPKIQVQTLGSGSIDVLYSLEPIPTLAEIEIDARIISRGLLASHIHNPFYAGAGVIATSVVNSRSEAVSSYRGAIREALQFIASNDEDARALMTSYASVSAETAQKMSLVGWVEPRSVSLPNWRAGIEALVEMGLMPSEVELERTFLGN